VQYVNKIFWRTLNLCGKQKSYCRLIFAVP
jgi:hypothetical protein